MKHLKDNRGSVQFKWVHQSIGDNQGGLLVSAGLERTGLSYLSVGERWSSSSVTERAQRESVVKKKREKDHRELGLYLDSFVLVVIFVNDSI